MLLYCNIITPRLAYIAEFISKQIHSPLSLTSSVDEFKQFNGIKINYSSASLTQEEVWISPHTLLFETDIKEQEISCFNTNGSKAFFKTGGDLPFDIFAASFYFLSRYEEYLPHTKNSYGLYSHKNSLAWREGFLNKPVVNIWISKLKEAIKEIFPTLTTHHSPFTFLPTYDIDIAWSYLHKGFFRNTGGMLRSLLYARFGDLKERIKVLSKKQHDPYDAYHWMNQLHHQYKLRPYYFFLLAGSTGRYDKNIAPGKKAMKQLIHQHAVHYPLGIHPSWRSGDETSLLKKEMGMLYDVTGVPVYTSRQHYIRFTLPETYRILLENGIRSDFSMGYGSINGFRASVASPFYWYDLVEEKQTKLLLYPFCYMDANSFYEQKYTAAQALDEMRHYYKVVKEVNGTLSMIWHNSFLGTGKAFKGWKEAYETFIKEITLPQPQAAQAAE